MAPGFITRRQGVNPSTRLAVSVSTEQIHRDQPTTDRGRDVLGHYGGWGAGMGGASDIHIVIRGWKN